MNCPSVVGEVPEDLREIMTQPLPDWSTHPHYPGIQVVSTIYGCDEELAKSLADRGLDERYINLFRTVERIGGLTLSPFDTSRANDYFQTDIVQGSAETIRRGLRWHTDKGYHSGRLISSDRFGTLYKTPDGIRRNPDFGILRLSDLDDHSPDREAQGNRTRLIISILPGSGDIDTIN